MAPHGISLVHTKKKTALFIKQCIVA